MKKILSVFFIVMFTSLLPLPPSEIFGNPTWPPKDYVTILPINKSMFTITSKLCFIFRN